MATTTLKDIIGVKIQAASTQVYLVPAATEAILTELIVCNTDASARQCQICIVPNGGTDLAVENTIRALNKTIAAYDTEIWSLRKNMDASGKVTAKSDSANVVSIMGSAAETA